MKETLQSSIPQEAYTDEHTKGGRGSDKVVMHFPLGESQGGYGFTGAGLFIQGAEVHQNQLDFPIPQDEELVHINPNLILIATDHNKKLREAATVFRALLAKKA